MPISYRIDKSVGLLLLRGSGAITAEDLVRVADAIVANPDRGAVTMELVNFGETSWNLSEQHKAGFEHMDRVYSRHLRLSRRALVVRSDLHFGLASVYSQCIAPSGLEVTVFRDEGEARAWLGLEMEAEEP
jgi:hypothetical protein